MWHGGTMLEGSCLPLSNGIMHLPWLFRIPNQIQNKEFSDHFYTVRSLWSAICPSDDRKWSFITTPSNGWGVVSTLPCRTTSDVNWNDSPAGSLMIREFFHTHYFLDTSRLGLDSLPQKDSWSAWGIGYSDSWSCPGTGNRVRDRNHLYL